MPRPRSIPDDVVLDAALGIVHRSGPAALSFAPLAAEVGLAPSTLVQRFGSKPALLQAALLRAWDLLDAETEAAVAAAPGGPDGAVELLVSLSGPYGSDEHADGLVVLREDLRDPVLRARGAAWIATLVDAVEERLAEVPGGPAGLGEAVVAAWQGSLIVWGFTRAADLPEVVRRVVGTVVERAVRDRDLRPGAAGGRRR